MSPSGRLPAILKVTALAEVMCTQKPCFSSSVVKVSPLPGAVSALRHPCDAPSGVGQVPLAGDAQRLHDRQIVRDHVEGDQVPARLQRDAAPRGLPRLQWSSQLQRCYRRH